MSQVLREDLLTGASVLVAGPAGGPASLLGARLRRFDPPLDEGGEGGAEWVAAQDRVDALLFDAQRGFTGGPDGLRSVLEEAWIACAAVANGAFIPAGGGRIILVAPAPAAGELSAGAVAGLENLARTLSVEWARYGVTTTAIAPADETSQAELYEVVGFLLSRAGAYFSGARLDLNPVSR